VTQVSEDNIGFQFRIGMSLQSRQKSLFCFPSSSMLGRVPSTYPAESPLRMVLRVSSRSSCVSQLQAYALTGLLAVSNTVC